MRIRHAALLLLLLLASSVKAQASVSIHAFPVNQPPDALVQTAMAVVEGETEIRLTFGGDCTLGGTQNGGAKRFASVVNTHGYAYPFANLLALLSEDDLTLVNLEGVLSSRKLTREKKAFNFLGDPAYTAILTQGSVECVSLANNHVLDYGAAGKADTIAALETAGLAFVDDNYATILQKDGVRVGFTASGLRFDQARFLKQAEVLRSLGCAALVHVMHMGEEYAATLTQAQKNTAAFLAEQGVLLVVGHHPHVAQGLEIIGHTTVAYSLGNLVFGGNTDPRDYDAYLLSASLYFTDGNPKRTQVTLWPLTISGKTRSNDYQPALLSGEAALRVMKKIQQSSAFTIAPYLTGQGAPQVGIDLQ